MSSTVDGAWRPCRDSGKALTFLLILCPCETAAGHLEIMTMWGSLRLAPMSRHLVLFLRIITIAVTCWVVYAYLIWVRQNTLTDGRKPLITINVDEGRILYLLQTEECLPSHLESVLGNSSACQCDVVVLSYKRICNDASLSNVRYLFNQSTTWTTGRNLLFYTNIYHRSDSYLYYILMDDDIQLGWTRNVSRIKDPWRSFEEFLLRVQPAVAALPLSSNAERGPKKCHGKEYTPTVWFDSAFNAFHFKAVEHILPYLDRFDNLSWYYSQLYNIVWCEIVFTGQVVMHRELIAFNKKHRSYRRGKTGGLDAFLPTILKVLRERIPGNCRNSSLIWEWERGKSVYGKMRSSTYCLPPPLPNQPVTALC